MKSEGIIKEYNIFNVILIILVIAMIFLPFISRVVNKLFPITYGCLSYRILGEPCPLCGFTRDILAHITNVQSIEFMCFSFIIYGILFYILDLSRV